MTENTRRTLRQLLVAACFVGVHVLLDRSTMFFQIWTEISAWYPQTGLAFAVLIGFGPRYAVPIVIAADFAVLNLIADHVALFAMFDRLLASKGYVIVNMLNPFFMGDARHGWWRTNLGLLLRSGGYAVEGGDGPIYRFTPAAVARSARPRFQQILLYPGRLGLTVSQYMFMVFRKMA